MKKRRFRKKLDLKWILGIIIGATIAFIVTWFFWIRPSPHTRQTGQEIRRIEQNLILAKEEIKKLNNGLQEIHKGIDEVKESLRKGEIQKAEKKLEEIKKIIELAISDTIGIKSELEFEIKDE